MTPFIIIPLTTNSPLKENSPPQTAEMENINDVQKLKEENDSLYNHPTES